MAETLQKMDRRRALRVSLGGMAIIHRNGTWFEVGVSDVSSQGMGVLSSRVIQPGIRLRVVFMLPNESLPILATAVVAYCRALAGSHEWGLRFLWASPVATFRLYRYSIRQARMRSAG